MIIKYKNQTFQCLMDYEDIQHFSKWNWYYRCGYVGRRRTKKDAPGGQWVHLHREILSRVGIIIPKRMCVDHINRNRMDNRKENLRVVTRSENGKNTSTEEKQRKKEIYKKAVAKSAILKRTESQLAHSAIQAQRINSTGKNRHFGANNRLSKKVIDTSTGIVYSCIREAAEVLGHGHSTLRSRLNGGLKNTTTLKYFPY